MRVIYGAIWLTAHNADLYTLLRVFNWTNYIHNEEYYFMQNFLLYRTNGWVEIDFLHKNYNLFKQGKMVWL